MLERPSDSNVPVTTKFNPVEQYANAAMQQTPSTAGVFGSRVLSGIMTPAALIQSGRDAIFGRPKVPYTDLHQAMELINPINVEGFEQKTAGFLGDMVGQTLSMAPLGAARLGAAGVEAAAPYVGSAISKIAPPLARFGEREIPQLGLSGITKQTIGAATEKSAKLGAEFAAFSAPEALNEAYDPETNKFNLGKASVSIGVNGALGAFIPSGQYLLGLLGGRITRGVVKEITPESSATAENAVETTGKLTTQEREILQDAQKAFDKGIITKRQLNWINKYYESPNAPEVHREAANILNDEGHQANAVTNMVSLKLLTDNASRNIDSAAHDALFADVDHKTGVTDYMHHDQVDQIRTNPEVADGIDGWTSHIDEHLKSWKENITKLEGSLFDGINEEMPFSQADILSKVKSIPSRLRQSSQFEYTLPENVESHLKQLDKIAKLQEENETLFKEYETSGDRSIVKSMKENDKEIKNITSSLLKIHSPREELEAIKDKLIKNGKLVKGFRNSKAYFRLADLSHYWPQARRMLDRIHLEGAHDAQMSYSNLLKTYSALIKAPLPKLAQSENLTNYLRQRIEFGAQKANLKTELKRLNEPKPQMEHEANENQGNEKSSTEATEKSSAKKSSQKGGKESSAKAEAIDPAARAILEKSEAKESKNDFEESNRRFKAFKAAGKILENLISCQYGANNGQL